MQEVYFFFDDSGVLHRNEPSGYFVYAGLVFTDRDSVRDARLQYADMNRKLREELNRRDELKACSLEKKHRRALFNSVRKYDSVAVVVNVRKVYDYILADKKSICRYKDYVLKRCVKNKLKRLIASGDIDGEQDIRISIFMDEQLTATNGYYDLRDSIREELMYGIVNFNYGITHPHLFDSKVEVSIKYCDSKRHHLIQASDIIANRIWTSYKDNDKELRQILNHSTLTFP